jgi:hypothetical protein
MTTSTELASTDDGAHRIYARSRMNLLFALWAAVMHIFRKDPD